MYRTANGKTVDMNALRNRNEHVRAVGNMNVNARGDTIDSNNQVISDANRRINSMYNKTVAQGQARTQPQATTNSQYINQQVQQVPVTNTQPLSVNESAAFDEFDSEPIIK